VISENTAQFISYVQQAECAAMVGNNLLTRNIGLFVLLCEESSALISLSRVQRCIP